MADAFAEYFIRKTLGGGQFYFPCNPTGPEKELSVAAFIGKLLERSSREFMDVWRTGKFTDINGGRKWPAQTVEQFQAVWEDRSLPTLFLVDHAPGSWNTDAIFRSIIYGAVTGVEEQQVASFRPAFRVFPLPASGSFMVEGTGLRGMSLIEFRLFDASGRIVRSRTSNIDGPGVAAATISTEGLASGVYFVQARPVGGKPLRPTRRVMVLR